MSRTKATNQESAITKNESGQITEFEAIGQLGDFGKLDGNQIEYMQPPFNVRNNKQVGMWALDEETMIAKTIKISIIKCIPYYGKLGKGAPCKWLQIFFVAAPEETNIPQNLVCVTYTAKQSVAELGQKLAMVRSNYNALLGVWTCGFKRHSNEKGDYYSVSWDWAAMEETPENVQFVGKIAKLLDQGIEFTDTGLPAGMFEVTGTDEEAIDQYIKWKESQDPF